MEYKIFRIATKTTKKKNCEACQKPISSFRIERTNGAGRQCLCLDCVMARHEQYLVMTATPKKGVWARLKSLF